MSAPVKFAVDIGTGRMYKSDLSAESFTLPLIHWEEKPIAVTLVERDPLQANGRLTTLTSAGVALTARLVKNDSVTVLSSTLLVASGDVFYGNLLLDLAAFVGLGYAYQGFLFFDIVETASFKRVRIPQEIIDGPETNILPDPPPGGFVDLATMMALFVPRDGGEPGQGYIQKNKVGGSTYRYYGDDGITHDDTIS